MFAHNIAIKRYSNKRIFFSSKYFSDVSKYFQTASRELSKNKYFQFPQEKIYIG